MNVRKKTVAFLFLITGLLLLATVAVASALPTVTPSVVVVEPLAQL